MKIVETDNFGGDYPHETVLNIPATTEEHAQAIADAINRAFCNDAQSRRFWKVVENNYVLDDEVFEG